MIREGLKLSVNPLVLAPDFINRIRPDGDVAAVILFGSVAQGKLKPLSDLDLALLLSSRMAKDERMEKQLNLLALANSIFRTDEIDLIVLNDAPPRMAHNILKTGMVLFVRDKNSFSDFRERITRLYLDFKYFRDSFDREFLKGIGYYGRTNSRTSHASEPVLPAALRCSEDSA
jgi:uncharacterized protein